MEMGKPMTTRLTLRRWLLLAAAALLAAPALADQPAGPPGKRGEEPPAAVDGRWRDLTPEQREFIRQRHQAHQGGGDAAASREARRERWREISPAEREQHRELRRQARQLSAEERQQLRRDILEANRDDRRR